MSVLIYVQHLLGVGHLQRAACLANALAEHDLSVDLVSGGKPATLQLRAGVTLHQLPPVASADGHFDRLLDEHGREIDDRWRDARRQQLLALYRRLRPQILITETFPFGRRMLRFELLPLLDCARTDPDCRLVVCSIRDILQPKRKPGREAEVRAWIERYYDHILVHGDPRLAGLEASFAETGEFAEKVAYSGYLGDTRPIEPGEAGRDEVLVSAGGSDTGLELLRTALAARPLCRLRDHRWRLLVSPAIADAQFAELEAQAAGDVLVERNRADFSACLSRARLSISQAGYNTVFDLLRHQVPAVLVPYAAAEEIEQTHRAGLLAARNRASVVSEAELSPTALARAIDAAAGMSTDTDIRLDGAERSVGLLMAWLEAVA